MGKKSRLSSEHATALENFGFVKAGYDPERDREIYYKALKENSTIDPKMLPREYFNSCGRDLILELDGESRFAPGSQASLVEFKKRPFPKETFCFCPHGYYKAFFSDGTPFEGGLHTNFGDEMFKKQTKLSRPEAPSTRVFQKH